MAEAVRSSTTRIRTLSYPGPLRMRQAYGHNVACLLKLPYKIQDVWARMRGRRAVVVGQENMHGFFSPLSCRLRASECYGGQKGTGFVPHKASGADFGLQLGCRMTSELLAGTKVWWGTWSGCDVQ